MFVVFFRRLLIVLLAFSFFQKSISNTLNQVETYINNLNCVYSKFFQNNKKGSYSGKFWLSRECGIAQVKISYTAGVKQDILIKDKNAIINDGKRKRSLSISKSPIYSILSGKLELSPGNIEILEDSEKMFVIKLKSYINGELTLIFSKFEKTKNIKDWEGWIFADGRDEILFTFDPDTWSVNDKSKVPLSVFK